MQEKFGFISLDEVIYDYIDANEISIHKFFKLWQLAYRGMSQLGLQIFFEVNTVKLPINPNQTVNLPSDFQNYTKVGVLNGRGEIVNLHHNNKLTKFADLFPNRSSETVDNTLYQYYNFQSNLFYNYWNGTTYGNLYGLPSGGVPAGTFTIDRTNNVILLGEGYQNIFNYVMLEYIATPSPDNGKYFIPQIFREALISFLNWKNLPPKMMGSGQWGALKHDYYNERRLALAAFKPFHLWEAYQWNATSTRLTVKT